MVPSLIKRSQSILLHSRAERNENAAESQHTRLMRDIESLTTQRDGLQEALTKLRGEREKWETDCMAMKRDKDMALSGEALARRAHDDMVQQLAKANADLTEAQSAVSKSKEALAAEEKENKR